MTAGFIRREPTDHTRLHSQPKVVASLKGVGWLSFFDKLDGFDDAIALEFAQNSEHIQVQDNQTHEFHTNVRGLDIGVNEDFISEVTEIPRGQPWDKDDRALNNRAKTSFFRSYEKSESNRNGVKRESLPDEWGEVAYHIMKYLTCEGRLSIVYAYHLRMLYQIRNLSYQKPQQRISIPHLLLHSLKEMCIRVKKGKLDAVAHHCLIKLIVCHKLQEQLPQISWNQFVQVGVGQDKAPDTENPMTPPTREESAVRIHKAFLAEARG